MELRSENMGVYAIDSFFFYYFFLLIYFLERVNQVISLKAVFFFIYYLFFFLKYIFIFILFLLFNP